MTVRSPAIGVRSFRAIAMADLRGKPQRERPA